VIKSLVVTLNQNVPKCMQELERADSGLRSEASVQGALAIYAIHSFGTPEQHARWVPGLVSGERVGCFALTEHGHGSDPGGMEARATRHGEPGE